MRNLLIAMLVVVLLSMPFTVLAQDTFEATITGQVINDTAGVSVSSVPVTLYIYIYDVLADSRTTVTDSEGIFTFNNVDMENTYLVSAKYMNVDYYYQAVFGEGETTAYVTARVCDVTNDDSAIRIGKGHTVIELEEDNFKVTGILWLFNDSNHTLTGTDTVLVFTLPDGARDFDAPEDLMIDYVLLEDGRFTYLVPFPPGERQLIYSYRLDRPATDEVFIPVTADYPVDSLEVMVTGENIEVAVNRLAPADPLFAETGERFIHFEGVDIPRGTVIEVAISGLKPDPMVPIYVWIIVAAVAGGVIAYLIIGRLEKIRNAR